MEKSNRQTKLFSGDRAKSEVLKSKWQLKKLLPSPKFCMWVKSQQQLGTQNRESGGKNLRKEKGL